MTFAQTECESYSKRRIVAWLLLAAAGLTFIAFKSSAAIITTYAGGGSSTAEGIPATNAFIGPAGLAVDPAGNLYIADPPDVRRVDHATRLITTFAGAATQGSSGDGGPATNALFYFPLSLAADLAGNLYVCDEVDARIRKINLATGTIATVAGNGIPAYAGDGGPATNASLLNPQGVAVDVHGNIYIPEWADGVVRKVDATNGIIHIVAGRWLHGGYSGDGGPATDATLAQPLRVAVDASGNLFILDSDTITHIRRVDGQTGIITTVAGGGVGDGSSGLATNANLAAVNDIAVDNLGGLYIGGTTNVWKVNLNTGTISIVAGGATTGFAGDGGPATNALLNLVLGIAVSGTGDIYLSDDGNLRVRRITPDTVPPYGVLVDLTTAPAFLDPMPAVQGRLGLATVNGRSSLVLPNGTNATAGLTVSGANGLAIVGATGTNSLSLTGLTDYGGSLTLSGLTNLNWIDLTTITNIGGSLTLTGNGSSSVFVGSPNVAGNIVVSTSGGGITVGSPRVSGNIAVSQNGSGPITVGGAIVSGKIDVSGNGTGSLTVGGTTSDSISVSSTGTGAITVGGANTVSGGVTITSNGSGSVNVGGAAVTGNVTVTGNGTNSTTLTGTSIGGNLSVSLAGGASADVSGTQTAGSVSVTTSGGSIFTAATGDSTTTVVVSNGPATLHAVLPTNTFTTNVTFSVQSVATTNGVAAAGTASDGTLTSVTPVAQYQFAFAIPTLNQNATLTFDITLTALDPTNRATFLAALNSGAATVAVQGDAPGSLWQAFPICGSGQPPTPGGCVTLVRLDASGLPLPDGSPQDPAAVRFTGLAGHFSKWGVVLSQPVRVGASLLAGGTLRLTWPGVAAGVLETSTNLAPNSWSPAGATTYLPDGTVRLDVSPSEPARFYRLRAH